MNSTLLVLTSAPDEPPAASCLALARNLREAGRDVELLLLQDAVLLATLDRAPGGVALDELAGKGIRFLVLEDDLRLRGFGKADVRRSGELVSYRTAVRRMAGEGTAVKGCF